MKTKTKTYLLLAAVIGIWGVIGFKIVNGLSSDDISEVRQENFDVTFKPKVYTKIDTFSIQTLNRDPFLGMLSKRGRNRVDAPSSKSNHSPIEHKLDISYSGLVKKQNTSSQVFVVNINKNQYLLKKGQITDSVKLISGNDQEILVRVNNNNYKIKRH